MRWFGTRPNETDKERDFPDKEKALPEKEIEIRNEDDTEKDGHKSLAGVVDFARQPSGAIRWQFWGHRPQQRQQQQQQQHDQYRPFGLRPASEPPRNPTSDDKRSDSGRMLKLKWPWAADRHDSDVEIEDGRGRNRQNTKGIFMSRSLS